jgi:MFS family permease
MKLISRLKDRYSFVEGNFLILLLSWILMFFSGPIPSTYSSLYFKGLGADDFFLGVIGFAGSIAIALVQFPGGYMADKHGRRWLVVTLTFGVTLSYILFVFAPSWQFIVLGIVLQNFCLLYQPALFAIMLDSVRPEYRGRGFTLQNVLTNLVSLPASIIAGYLVLAFDLDIGMRVAYAITMIAYFVAAMLRTKLKETLPSDKNRNRPEFLPALKEYPKSVKDGLTVWSKVPRATLHLFVAATGINSLIAGCNMYFVVYATNVLHVQKFQWAIVMAFMAASVAIPTILAGFRMDAVGRKHFFVFSLLLYAPAMIIFVNASFNLLLAAFFLFGLGQMLQGTSYNSLLGDLTPRDLRGKVIGCGQFFMYLSQAVTQLLVGALYTYVSPQLPFILLAAGAIPLSILAFYKIPEPSTRQA